ncbi:MAG: hypothetical protein IPP15_00100 [Saprospiraceae bacterium]|uniref:Fibronectin type III domain-containing protein n=1 Tax=Candidatus Opimibacter skivensis TaxID=2982028 RepID=A0A9D7SPR5_9BACT|nr:hypothetical protein [Candidatus Opimibacter skivensis]
MLFIAVALFFTSNNTAQVSTYGFTQSIEGFAQTTQGTKLGNASNAGHRSFLDPVDLTGSTTSTFGAGIPIGFNFIYQGISYDRFGVLNNGWICLGRSQYGTHAVDIGQFQYQPLEGVGPVKDTLRARIVAFDANLVGNGTTSSLTYELIGDSTDLTLIVKWKKYKIFQFIGTNNTTVNFEIRLNAIDGSIDIRYGEMKSTDYSGITSSNVGLGGLQRIDFNNRKTPISKDWNLTTPGTTYGDDCIFQTTSIMPELGLNFHWSPSLCPSIPYVNRDYISDHSIQLSWHASEAISSPEYEYALTTIASPPSSGTITNESSHLFTGLMPNTQFYFHIRLRCSVSLQSSWTSHAVKTRCNVLSPPYFENFEAITPPSIPDCMSIINNNPESQTWITAEEIGLSGPNALTIPYEPFLMNDDWLFLPGLNLEEDTNYIFSLDYATYNSDTLQIYTGHYPDPDSMTLLANFHNPDASGYLPYDLFYTPPADGQYFFALRSKHADIQVDNISLKKYTCFKPSNIHVTSNLLNHTVLKWNVSTPGTSYEYSVSTNESYPPPGVLSTTADSVLFTDLTPATTYHFYLRADCGAGNLSPWTHFVFESRTDYDDCASAIILVPSPISDCDAESYGNTGATSSGVMASTCAGYPDDDVWFKFTALYRSHNIKLMNSCLGGGGGGTFAARDIDTSICQPLIMELRSGSCGATLHSCKEVNSGLTGFIYATDLTPGSVYYIRVFGKDTLRQGQHFGLCVGSYPTEPNSSCATATLLTVSTSSCPAGFQNNLAGALSATTPISPCDAPPYFALWYIFVTTATTQIIEANFETGNGVLDVFSGTCGTLVNLACANNTTSGSEQLTLTGLTIGQTLYVRVFDAGNTGAQMNVSVCIRVPAVNDECANAINIPVVSGITFANPINANSFSASGTGTCSTYFADDDLWFKFTATNDTHLIVTIPVNPSPLMTTPVIECYSGNCSGSSIGCSGTGEFLLSSLTPGNEYYFKIYSAPNLTGRGNFRVGITIPPPNISCSTATLVPVNASQTCTLNTAATMVGTGVKNEIWFSFISTTSSMTILVTETLGLDIALYDGCNGNFIVGEQQGGSLYYRNYVPGNTYYFKIYAPVFSNLNYQYFQEQVTICIIPAPANDECSSPIMLSTQAYCTITIPGSTAGATPSITNGSCYPGEYDTWYSFVATSVSHKILVDPDPGFFYVKGQVFKGNCSGTPIACFSDGIGMADGVAILDDLDIDSTYFIRVAVYNPSVKTGEFSICISSPPANDHCMNATVMTPNSTTACANSIPGTTINATSTLGRQNVWYIFTAASKNVTIVVTPSTPGFDPGIKLWNPTTGISLDNCVFDIKSSNDEAHVNYEPEILSLSDLTIGNSYYIEVYTNTDNLIAGDFEICLYSPEDKMTLHSAVSESYPFDTIVSAGTFNQPVTKVTLQLTGRLFNKVIRKINFDASGTTDMNDVLSASVYIDTKFWGFHNNAILPYKPFGKVGEGLSEYPPPFLFGTTINHPGTQMEFNGEYIIPGERYSNSSLGSDNYPRLFYLVMEIACDADPGHVVKAICNSITFEIDSITPILGNTDPLSIVPLDSYDTRSDGQWNDGSTWVCGTPPPHDPSSPPVNIYHRVMLTDTADVGSINIYYQRALELTDVAQLTMGSSSMGAATGNTNKLLFCPEGSLLLDHATLNINGGFTFGTAGGEMYGDGLCCNNGNGSYSLSVGNNPITRDSNFVSVDYFPFCVAGGQIVSANYPNPPAETQIISANENSSTIDLFKKSNSRDTKDIPGVIKNYTILDIDPDNLEKVLTGHPENLSLTIPLEQRQNLELELELSNSFLANTIIRSAPDMNVINLPKGVHYRGKIKGDPKSVVAISFFDDEVIGIISGSTVGNINLGKKKNSNHYIAYNDHQVKEFFGFTCTTSDDGEPYTDEQIHFKTNHRSTGDCIGIYVEVDHDIVADKGGLTPAANYITAIINQVALLYANENISIQLSEMTLWTSPSPYNQNTLGEVFEKFKSIRTSFNGDLGLLVSYNFSAGYAQLNGLCRTEQKYSTGYVGLFSTYLNVPVYSWSVEVMAHELGHLFNSRHTHACAWNGNQTAIDGCYTVEGNCNNINTLPENGGTVMSYCHLTDAGINFAEGFGIQPGNVMRYAVDQSTCTQSCSNQACTMNDLNLTVRTDSSPNETKWHIEDAAGNILFNGGPYIQSNFTYTKHFCVPDGCYRLIMTDAVNTKPGGTFVAKDSKIILDGNDGLNPATNSYFRILTSNNYTDHLNITILDPGSFLYGTEQSMNQTLNGTLTFGGGDDTGASTGFTLGIGPGNGFGLLILDSLIIQGGYASQNRQVSSSSNFVGCKNIWIKPGSEFKGGLAITHDFRNDGLYTGRLNRNLSFCGSMNIGQHYPNTTTTQRMYGTGLVRSLDTAPIPSSPADNQINMLRVDNTYDGLSLEMPLGVLNTIRLMHGVITTSDTTLLTLGDSISIGYLSTDPSNTQWFAADTFIGNMTAWDGGTIEGPFRRWFTGNTTDEQSVFPLGKGTTKRTAGIHFLNTTPGYLTGTFKAMQPGINGLPLTNEQNTNIGFVSPSGYWNFESAGTSGTYAIDVRANGFTTDGVIPISSLPSVRLIKRPSNGSWQLSGSTTTAGPLSLNQVTSAGLNSFSDFGIGLNCGNVVTTGSDNIVGSLRYVLANCISSGDTVKFDTSLSLLIVTTDTIILDKNVTIYATSDDNINIEGSGVHSIMKIQTGKTVKLQNLELTTGNALDGKAIYNKGNLTINHITIHDIGTGNSTILNKGSLIVIGSNSVLKE